MSSIEKEYSKTMQPVELGTSSYFLTQSISGPGKFTIQTDGIVVRSVNCEFGFGLRGIEKIAEQTDWIGFLPYCERIDYVSGTFGSLAYALAVEKICGIEVSARATTIRLIISEISRVLSHLMFVSQFCAALGFETGKLYALRDREQWLNVMEMLTGARILTNYVRIGGVAADVTEGFIEKIDFLIRTLRAKLSEYADFVEKNFILRDRLQGLGKLSGDKARLLGVTGPVLRSSGVAFDVRRAFPYLNYSAFEFEVATGKESSSDSFSRFSIRLEEIRQSLIILKQAIESLVAGSVGVHHPRVFKVPVGEAYVSVESPRGLLGVYVQSAGGKQPARVRFRTPSFGNVWCVSEVLNGVDLSDISVILETLDLSFSEIDR